MGSTNITLSGTEELAARDTERLKAAMSAITDTVKSAAASSLTGGAAAVSDGYELARERSAEALDAAEGWLRGKALMTAGLAACAGLLIGFVLRWRHKRAERDRPQPGVQIPV